MGNDCFDGYEGAPEFEPDCHLDPREVYEDGLESAGSSATDEAGDVPF